MGTDPKGRPRCVFFCRQPSRGRHQNCLEVPAPWNNKSASAPAVPAPTPSASVIPAVPSSAAPAAASSSAPQPPLPSPFVLPRGQAPLPSPFVRPEVEGQAPLLRRETKNPKLNSYERETNETACARAKRCPSYDLGLPQAPQSAPNRPQNHVSQLRRETKNPKLNSYERETNETGISYEKHTFSYDSGLTPSCKSLQTRPQTTLAQLRLETSNPKLNSYQRETNETRSPFCASEMTR